MELQKPFDLTNVMNLARLYRTAYHGSEKILRRRLVVSTTTSTSLVSKFPLIMRLSKAKMDN